MFSTCGRQHISIFLLSLSCLWTRENSWCYPLFLICYIDYFVFTIYSSCGIWGFDLDYFTGPVIFFWFFFLLLAIPEGAWRLRSVCRHSLFTSPSVWQASPALSAHPIVALLDHRMGPTGQGGEMKAAGHDPPWKTHLSLENSFGFTWK